MIAINWYVIEKLNYQNYECVNMGETVDDKHIYKYVLEPLECFKIQEDLYLTVKKELMYNSVNNNEKHINNNLDIIYTLYSNSNNIKNILEQIICDFNKYKNNVTNNKILYHFTYCGLNNGELKFNYKVLSEQNTIAR